MDRRLTQRHVDAFYGIADALAKRITEDQAALEALVGDCAGDAEPTTACAGDFVRSFGARVFRRPLTDAEVDRYLELRTAGTASSEVFFGILFTLLLSPEMLYHLEIGGDPTADEPRVLALTAHEKAARLSYLFWGTMPDAELARAAEAGELDDDQGYQEVVERVFSDARTQSALSTFWREWLGIAGFAGFIDSPAFRAFSQGVTANDALFSAMADETQALIDHFTWEISRQAQVYCVMEFPGLK
jgi:hypothetical protein